MTKLLPIIFLPSVSTPTISSSLVSFLGKKGIPTCLLSLALLYPCVLQAQSAPSQISSSLAAANERAVVRSQASLLQAQNLMKQARGKLSQHNQEGAYLDAVNALALTPSGSAATKERQAIVSEYTLIALSYAREMIQKGRYQDAESAAKSVLEIGVNPGNQEAVRLLSDLEQPEIFNKTVTPKFADQRDEVVRLLRDANGLTQSGRYDLAMKQYEAALVIDPYNTAARKGMEEIHHATTQYADEAYNETRSRMLWQVEKAWERPPRKSKQGRSTESVGRHQDLRGTDQIVAKLNSINIPKIDLTDTPISEAVEYLKQKSMEQDPSKKGVNIFLKLSDQNPAASASNSIAGVSTNPAAPAALNTEPKITLALSHVPLYVALDYLSKMANLKLKIDPYAVSIVPLTEPTDILVTREYQVPPDFIPAKPLDSGAGLPQAGAPASTANQPRLAPQKNAQDYFTSLGIDFPTGASANYLSQGSKLIVRNTRDNIDQIDALVEAAMVKAPSQIEITTKFLEINQNNVQELGFDWLLGPFSTGGGVYGSGGGTVGTSANYPFGNPMGGGADMNTVGAVRSGSSAISGNSIDALISGQGQVVGPAPGIFSIAGIFNDPQFQLVIRALNQKKGIDLMAAPKVTTKNGKSATVKVIQKFWYPDQYTQPQIPNATGAQGANGGTAATPAISIPPTITPSFPSSFKPKELGVTLEVVDPTIDSDGYNINMKLHPQVTDFDGFINYGSPIRSVSYTNQALPFPGQYPYSSILTTNTINQPVFSLRDVTTVVTVQDGSTVALGGLIREDVQKVQDKIPFLGDIPMAGRLFRSDADQKIKKNLVIFVTPRILDAEGKPRRDETEEPEIVTPIGLPQDLPQPSVSSATLRTK